MLSDTNSFGFHLWIEGSERVVTSSKDAKDFVSGKEVTLRLQAFDVENYGTTPIMAKALKKPKPSKPNGRFGPF